MHYILLLWQPRKNNCTNCTKFSKPMRLSILKCYCGKFIFACCYLYFLSFFSVLTVIKTSSTISHALSHPASPQCWPSFCQDCTHSTLTTVSPTITSLPVALFRLPAVLPSWQSSTLDITTVWMRQVFSIFSAVVLPYASLWSLQTGMCSVMWTGWQKVFSFWIFTQTGSWGSQLCRP